MIDYPSISYKAPSLPLNIYFLLLVFLLRLFWLCFEIQMVLGIYLEKAFYISMEFRLL
jgi:hypothetical protein